MIRTAFTTDRQKFRRSQGNDAMKGPWVFHPPGKRKPVAGYVYIAVSKRGFCKVGTAANPRARSYEFARKYDAKICLLVEASDRRSLEGLIYRISGVKPANA